MDPIDLLILGGLGLFGYSVYKKNQTAANSPTPTQTNPLNNALGYTLPNGQTVGEAASGIVGLFSGSNTGNQGYTLPDGSNGSADTGEDSNDNGDD